MIKFELKHGIGFISGKEITEMLKRLNTPESINELAFGMNKEFLKTILENNNPDGKHKRKNR